MPESHQWIWKSFDTLHHKNQARRIQSERNFLNRLFLQSSWLDFSKNRLSIDMATASSLKAAELSSRPPLISGKDQQAFWMIEFKFGGTFDSLLKSEARKARSCSVRFSQSTPNSTNFSSKTPSYQTGHTWTRTRSAHRQIVINLETFIRIFWMI